MSEDEQYIIQGRAYADLKKTKARVATLTTELSRYSENLIELGHMLAQFIDDPAISDREMMMGPSENLKHHLQRAIADAPFALITDLRTEAERIKRLEKQIAQF